MPKVCPGDTAQPYFLIVVTAKLYGAPTERGAQLVKNLPAMWEIWIRSLGWEDILEKGMATHFSILAWRIPRDRSLAGYSPQGHKELNMTERVSTKQ